MISPFAGAAAGSPAAVDHRHRVELDPPCRLRGHRALADGAVQREDAGRPRPRHRLDRQARSGGGDALDGGVPAFPRAVRAGRRRAALRDRDRRGARGGERPGLHPPRRSDPRHRDPRADAAARKPITRRSASFPASIRPTASPATSAAAASNWSTSTARRSATASRCRSAACACRTWRRTRSPPRRRIARERDRQGEAAEGRRRAGPSTRSAAPGETSPGCT